MSKKLLTKLLALTMCAGLVMQPVTAFAQETPDEVVLLEEDDGEDDDSLLPTMQNVKLEGDTLSWDPVAGASMYGITIGKITYNSFGISENLNSLFRLFKLADGIYNIKLFAENASYERITQYYELVYVRGVEPVPQPKIIIIENVKATSNIADLVDFRGYSEPDIVDEDGYVLFDSIWERFDGEKWEDMGSCGKEALPLGTYRIRTTMSIVPNSELAIAIDENITLTVDDQQWNDEEIYTYTDMRISSAVFTSPEFEVKGIPMILLPEIQNVKLEGDILSWDKDPNTAYYIVEIEGTGETAEDSVNLRSICDRGWKKNGTHKVTLVGVDEKNNHTTQIYETYYEYKPAPEPKIVIIDTVRATSDFSQLVDNKVFTSPKFAEETGELTFETMYWWKMRDNGSWSIIGPGNGEAFAPGTYRCQIKVYLPYELYGIRGLADNVKLIVDGQEWTLIDVYGTSSKANDGALFYSPQIEIKGDEPIEPIDPEDPENITGGTWTSKWGANYYVTEDGEKLTGMNKVEGDYYLFSKKGSMQKNTFYEEDGKKYYFGSDGKAITGWLKKWNATYYFEDDCTMKTGFADIDDATYYFNAKGHLVKSKWIEEEGNKYYAKADGTLAKSETIKKWGKKYSFDADGVLLP